jgi:starch-binding outer membrane protein, SusD/RagB family
MIKKILYTFLLPTCMLFGATGCTEWLTVKPESEIILEDFWKTETNVGSVLASCYLGLTRDDCMYRMIVWGELRSDNMVAGSGFPKERYDMTKVLEGDITSSNTYANWGSFYTVINYCNTVLANAPAVVALDENFTTGDLHRVQAEATAIRALCYFYLIRAFKEVPWVETPSVDDQQNFDYPKDTEKNIINHIISDLKSVRSWASTDFGSDLLNKCKITRNAIDALLADVYLWDEQYDACIQSCDAVLSDERLELVESKLMYASVFWAGSSPESIFELKFDDDVQKNNATKNLYGNSDDVFGELSFPTSLAYYPTIGFIGPNSPFGRTFTKLPESVEDIRSPNSYFLYGGMFFIFKYAGVGRYVNTSGQSIYQYRSDSPNWIIYRLSDVILMKAEALANKKHPDLAGAVAMVNKTYIRSNPLADSLNIANYTDTVEVKNLVLRERQREFLFEGKRWFDLVRLARRDGITDGINMYVNKKSTGNATSLGVPVLDAMYMPVSKTEMEANPNMIQNPYYEESGSSTR